MAELLCKDLNTIEKVTLGNMSLHPGYEVFKQMISEACRNATEAVIKLDPISDNYEKKLVVLQAKARTLNDFSASLLASIEWHTREGIQEPENDAADALLRMLENK